MSAPLVIPELDVVLRAFARHDPDPRSVRRMAELIQDRRLILVGWVRQGALARTADDRQFQRLLRALSGFPDLPIRSGDHVAAAALVRRLRARGASIRPAQSLLWTMAERIGARIWTRDPRWLALEREHPPLSR